VPWQSGLSPLVVACTAVVVAWPRAPHRAGSRLWGQPQGVLNAGGALRCSEVLSGALVPSRTLMYCTLIYGKRGCAGSGWMRWKQCSSACRGSSTGSRCLPSDSSRHRMTWSALCRLCFSCSLPPLPCLLLPYLSAKLQRIAFTPSPRVWPPPRTYISLWRRGAGGRGDDAVSG
jgi:hypothetical protein